MCPRNSSFEDYNTVITYVKMELIPVYPADEREHALGIIRGMMVVVKRCDPNEFWALLDLLRCEYIALHRGLYNQRVELLTAFQHHRLFTLRILDGDVNLVRSVLIDINTLPALCTVNLNNQLEIIWIHPGLKECNYDAIFKKHFTGQV